MTPTPPAFPGRLLLGSGLIVTGLIAAGIGAFVALPEHGAGLRSWIGAPLPGRHEHVGALQWWVTPIEKNAFARRFTATADLSDFAVMDDGRTIFVVGDDGTLLKSVNAGATWRSLADNVKWRDGTPLDDSNGPASERPTSLPALSSVAASPDGSLGIAVGENGTVLASDDNGLTWTERGSGTSASLFAVAFDAGTARAVAVGGDGTVLNSGDNGLTWTERGSGTAFTSEEAGATGSIVVHKGRIYPAPLSALGLLLSLGGLIILRYQPTYELPVHRNGSIDPPVSEQPPGSADPDLPGVLTSRKGIIDLFVSDRPLGPGDPDRLGYGRYAQGLSGLLRNRGTGFPITIAITGEWGVGKSSFMRLLEADLERRGYFAAWFNAWHDQNEENVLSSLLLAIREQAVPRIFSRNFRRAVELRVNLLLSRRMTYVMVMIFLVAAVASSLWPEFMEWLCQWLNAFAAAAIVIANGASAFGFNLRRGVSGFLGAAANSVDSAGRHERLRRDFKNVSHSIGRNLVIFIDDLDRCQPEKVVETLEAVNFLVTAGECAVVMGMDYQRVQHCVGLVRKDLAEAESTGATRESIEAERRTAYAHQYLQKLINVEMPIVAEPDRMMGLVANNEPSAEEQAMPDRHWRRLSWLRRLRVWVVLLGIVLGPLFVMQYARVALVPAEPSEAVSTIPDDEGPPVPESAPRPSTPDVRPPVSPQDDTGLRQPPHTAPDVVFWPMIVGLSPVLILGLLLVLHWLYESGRVKLPGAVATLVRRLLGRSDEVRDSKAFEKALEIWSEAIVHDDPTPRTFKRFLNRLRYFAAMLHVENGEGFDWRGEANLVALAALHHLNVDFLPPAMPRQLGLFEQDGGNLGVTQGSGAEDDEAVRMRIERILEACRTPARPGSWKAVQGVEVESPWPPDEREIEQFRKLFAGMHV